MNTKEKARANKYHSSPRDLERVRGGGEKPKLSEGFEERNWHEFQGARVGTRCWNHIVVLNEHVDQGESGHYFFIFI